MFPKNAVFAFLAASTMTFIVSEQNALAGTVGTAPQQYECEFIQEKDGNGKLNRATCSMEPEYVFKIDRTEHCRVQKVGGYNDLTPFNIDILNNTVSWTEVSRLRPETIKMVIEMYQKMGSTEKQATEQVKKETHGKRQYQYKILSIANISDSLYRDPETRESYKATKFLPAHLITFGEKGENFSLYLSGATDHAILSKFSTDGNSTWVAHRFGRCKKCNFGACG